MRDPAGSPRRRTCWSRGLNPLVLEAGPSAGTSVREWHHVRLFSRWGELVDPAAEKLLAPTGWQAPDADRYPTGAEWAEDYLQPLADALGDRVRYDALVVGVARRGRDRVVDADRDTEPLTVHVTTAAGRGADHRAGGRGRLGNLGAPNPLGADGLPALGERAAADRITYRVPDLDDPAVAARYAGRRVAVAGAGHSALTALVAFADLAERLPGTRVEWLLRRGSVGNTFGGGDADQLPARGALGQRAAGAVSAGHIHAVTGFRTAAVHRQTDGRLVAGGGRRASTRPGRRGRGGDRVPAGPVVPVRGPPRPGSGAAGPARPGAVDRPQRALLRHGLPARRRRAGPARARVFLVGMKSYGRAPTFLALTGYEQVRSIAAAIAGDREAAERVELVLPETGVCSGGGLVDETDTSEVRRRRPRVDAAARPSRWR